MLDTLVTGDMDDVAKALLSHHASARAFVFQHRIRRCRCAVKHIIDRAGRDAILGANLGDPLHDRARRIVGRCRDFVDRNLARRHVAIDDVGKSAADIHADHSHCLSLSIYPVRARHVRRA